jgi:hypothetical protein
MTLKGLVLACEQIRQLVATPMYAAIMFCLAWLIILLLQGYGESDWARSVAITGALFMTVLMSFVYVYLVLGFIAILRMTPQQRATA